MAQNSNTYEKAILGVLVLLCALQTWAIISLSFSRSSGGGSSMAAGAYYGGPPPAGGGSDGGSNQREQGRMAEPSPEQLLLGIMELESSKHELSADQARELLDVVDDMSTRYHLLQYGAEVLQNTLSDAQREFLVEQHEAAEREGRSDSIYILKGSVSYMQLTLEELHKIADGGITPLELPVRAKIEDPPYDSRLVDFFNLYFSELQANEDLELTQEQARAIAPFFAKLIDTHPVNSETQRMMATLTRDQQDFVFEQRESYENTLMRPTEIHEQVQATLRKKAGE